MNKFFYREATFAFILEVSLESSYCTTNKIIAQSQIRQIEQIIFFLLLHGSSTKSGAVLPS